MKGVMSAMYKGDEEDDEIIKSLGNTASLIRFKTIHIQVLRELLKCISNALNFIWLYSSYENCLLHLLHLYYV
jgi:hypothetical protein